MKHATATTATTNLTEPDLAAMKAAIKSLEELRASMPNNWTLIDPLGRVFTGSDPMLLAAQASYVPPGGEGYL